MDSSKTCFLFGPPHLPVSARLRLAPALKEQLRRIITEQNCRAFRLCDGGSFSRHPWLNASLHALTPLLACCDYYHYVAAVPYIGARKGAICHAVSQSDFCLMYPGWRPGYLNEFASDVCFFSDRPVFFLEK